MSVYRLSHAWIIGLLADANWRLRRVSVRISQDNYNIRRLYKRATKMASLSIPHSNFLFLGQGLKLCQFQYWSTHYQLRSMARYVTVLLSTTRKGLQGEQGWRSSESLAFHQCGPGSTPGVDAICGLSLLLVLSLALRGFSPGTPVFPSPQKPTFPNSNSTRNQVDEEPLCGCSTCKSLSLLLFIIIIKLVFSQTLRLAYRQVLHLHATLTTYTS